MQKWDTSGRREVGGSECSGRPVFTFFIKENWICAMTRHYAESKINILLTRNLPTDSCVRRWSHLLMIPLHCLWVKSNNRKHGQFECDDTWIWMFWFCWFTCTVHLLFSGFLDRVGDGLGIGGMVHLGKILKLNGQWVGDLEN